MAVTGRRLLCCCLLAGARAGLEDAEAMVQMTVQSSKPSGLLRLGDDAEAAQKKQKGNFFNTLALGAQVDGDSAMAQVLDGMGSMIGSMKPDETAPPRAILDGSKDDPLEQAAGKLAKWGKNVDSWYTSVSQKDPNQLLAGVGKAVGRALPGQFRELGSQMGEAAKLAKQGAEGAANGLLKIQQKVIDWNNTATEDQKNAVKEKVSNWVQKRIIESDPNSKDAQHIRQLVHWWRQDSGSKKKADPSWQGINKQVIKVNKFIKDPLTARQEAKAEKKAREAAAAAAPEVPAAQPQQQQRPQMQAAPPQQPQMQAAPPQQPRLQAAPPQQRQPMAPAYMPAAGPMGYSNYQYGYPMAPPPMMQQPPMGGMPPYPMQQQQLR